MHQSANLDLAAGMYDMKAHYPLLVIDSESRIATISELPL
jgi:hypothetical protein